MSDDIVTRLRQEVAKAENDGRLPSWELAKCAWTAADEIERLRSVSAMLTDEIERLRAEVARLRGVVVLCPKCYTAEHGTGAWEQSVRGE